MELPDPEESGVNREPSAEARYVAQTVADLDKAFQERGYDFPLSLQLAMSIVIHG